MPSLLAEASVVPLSVIAARPWRATFQLDAAATRTIGGEGLAPRCQRRGWATEAQP
jgi:hypothetical protein